MSRVTGRDATDVAIVGGGPAGLAAAIAAARRGFAVTVLDAARPPIDKACAEGLMPDSVAALRRLGVAVDDRHGGRFHGVRFRERDVAATARFPTGVGIGIRRTTLHALLVDRAAAAGVALRWGVRVRGLARDGVRLDEGELACHWTIGADGEHSAVRRWAALDDRRRERVRLGVRRHWRVPPWTDVVEVWWSDDAQAYVTPVSATEVCVAVLSRAGAVRFDELPARWPALAARLADGAPVTPARGARAVSRRLRHVTRGRVALVGDASGSVDPITGEGLCLAFRQAVALGGALGAGDLAAYERAHAALVRVPAMMERVLLLLDGRPALRRRALRLLARRPNLFARLLAIHVGARSPAQLGAGAAASLVWGLLAG